VEQQEEHRERQRAQEGEGGPEVLAEHEAPPLDLGDDRPFVVAVLDPEAGDACEKRPGVSLRWLGVSQLGRG
jgi:hypothetical protein